jgi:cell division initiation protein
MRISPIDIQQQQFKSRPFGYEKAGVDQFLELLAEEFERLIRKNQDLQEALARTNETLREMRDREETLKATLVTTQKMTEELKSTARREVDVMMAEAEIKAERLMHNAEERRLQLIDEIQEIKRQKIDFEVSLRGLLEKHIRMLDLNTVAIEQQDADSRLLEEPLPFGRPSGRYSEPAVQERHGSSVHNYEDAVFAEPDSPASAVRNPAPRTTDNGLPELSFDFDLGDDNSEEDLLK